MDTYEYHWFRIGIGGHTFDAGWRVVPGITATMMDTETEKLTTAVLIERVVPVE